MRTHLFHKPISYFMLIIFSAMFVKNLFSQSVDLNQDCMQMGHIHFFKINVAGSEQVEFSEDKSVDCHDFKVYFSYSINPIRIEFTEIKKEKISFKPIYKIENNFNDPDLNQKRKPPKLRNFA